MQGNLFTMCQAAGLTVLALQLLAVQAVVQLPAGGQLAFLWLYEQGYAVPLEAPQRTENMAALAFHAGM